jgi:hypothetical protein
MMGPLSDKAILDYITNMVRTIERQMEVLNTEHRKVSRFTMVIRRLFRVKVDCNLCLYQEWTTTKCKCPEANCGDTPLHERPQDNSCRFYELI